MEKKDNLFIKVQLEKEQHTGKLLLNIYFDKNAPNFFFTNDTISWYPTIDEIDFINETSTLINKKTNPTPPPVQSPLLTRQTPTTPTSDPPELVSFDEEPIQSPITADAPFETHCEETPPTKPPFINDVPPEEILASIPEKLSKTPVSDEEKLVQADEKSITKVLLEKLKKDNY